MPILERTSASICFGFFHSDVAEFLSVHICLARENLLLTVL